VVKKHIKHHVSKNVSDLLCVTLTPNLVYSVSSKQQACNMITAVDVFYKLKLHHKDKQTHKKLMLFHPC